jgi:hypothetical protein
MKPNSVWQRGSRMRDFVLDFSVNTFEAFCVYVLIMAVFRFPIRSHLPFAIVASAIMAQSSYLMRFVFHLDSYTPLLMLLWFVLLIWVLFRVHPFYSLLMTVTGYLTYIVIQALILLVLQIWFPIEQIVSPLLNMKIVQTVCSGITLAIAFLLDRRRLGFIFVPDGTRVKILRTRINMMLLAFSVAAGLLITGASRFILGGGILTSMNGALFLLIILVFLNLAYKREIADD